MADFSGTLFNVSPVIRHTGDKEGVFVGHRGYEPRGARPLFPFGSGLSYTTFRYGHLAVRPLTGGAAPGPPFEVAFDVQNTGSRDGADVAQVYVGARHACDQIELRGALMVGAAAAPTSQ